ATAFRRALGRRPGNLPLLVNLGNALKELGRVAEARRAYRAALALEPRSAAALSNLAQLEAESGDHAAARKLYKRVLALDPEDAEAWHDYSLIKTYESGDPDLAAMQSLRARPGLAAGKAMFLDFALGKALQDAGDVDAAFQRFASGNRLKRASLRYDVAGDEALVERIVATFDKAFLAAHAGAGAMDERPVFIVGMPRSGTSLVEQILSSHSRVLGAGEVNHFRDAVVDILGDGGRGFPEAVRDLAARDFRRLGEAYLERLALGAGKAARITDKMPRNFFFLGFIRLALPKARIVHCVRDPVDTCLSCYQIHFAAGQEFTYDLGDLGRYYRLYARLMDHWRAALPGRFLELGYEELVARPEPAMRRLLEFCGLVWEDACRDFHLSRRPVHTASAHQVHRPIYRTAVRRWKRYEKHLGPLLEALGPLAGSD
ncbi:MAG: sulfotransferase, partial [Rhodospirillales bacterium]